MRSEIEKREEKEREGREEKRDFSRYLLIKFV